MDAPKPWRVPDPAASARRRKRLAARLVEIEDIEVDAVTKSGVTPLMMAVESGKIQLVAEGLNNNLNPFLRDGLDRAPLDYAQKYKGNLGNDLR